MATSKLRKHVLSVLNGQEVRQAMRAAARQMERRLRFVCRARRAGSLLLIAEAIDTLRSGGVEWREENIFGIRILHTMAGVTLAYRPDGVLDWRSSPLLRSSHPGMEQLALFSEGAGRADSIHPAAELACSAE